MSKKPIAVDPDADPEKDAITAPNGGPTQPAGDPDVDPDADPGRAAAPPSGAFPAAALLAGHRARRLGWAPGYAIVVADAGGRAGQRLKLMATGARAGLVEWTPRHLADELMAEDWDVAPVAAVAEDPQP